MQSTAERRAGALREFLRTEAAGGVLLVVATAVALVWANSPWSHGYERLWSVDLPLSLDLRHWVNDGLMAGFFLVVGLEIRRETTVGHLAGRRAATLPVAAAIGGMAVPALLYLAIAGGTAAGGWGIPMATDIALAVGVLALVGVGALVVIAVVYSKGGSTGLLFVALAAVLAAALLRRTAVPWIGVLVVFGSLCWWALLRAGVHPTIAGVAFGLLTPPSAAERLEHRLHPVSSFVVVPVFALANAGVPVGADALRAAWQSPIAWGIALGLLVGKPVGVLAATRIATRSGAADAPGDVDRRHLLGMSNAAGIGFTVSLFVTELAFAGDSDRVEVAKVAVLVASVVSAAAAFAVLHRRSSRTR